MDRESIRTSRIVALSLSIGAFFTAQVVLVDLAANRPVGVLGDVLQESLFWAVWAALVPVVLASLRRWPLDAKPLSRSIIAHVAVSAALAALQTLVAFGLRPTVLWLAGNMARSDVLTSLVRIRAAMVWGLFMGVFFYWVIVGVYSGFRFRSLYAAERMSAAELARRGAALEAELAGAKLDALRSQLRPHFLFNTLNAISVLAAADASKTRQMLLRLSSLLRRSLDEEQHEVSLQRELAFLNDYLDIQRARFADRLSVHLAIDPAVLGARVPVFLLQPLMENAIEHGESNDGRTTITLRAHREGDTLQLTLEDEGPGVATDAPVREGIGLRNTRARLHQLYGSQASVELRAAREASTSPGVRVELRIPFSMAAE